MFKFLFFILISKLALADGSFYRQAKELAYKKPIVLNTVITESLVHKCTNYITYKLSPSYNKFYVLDCFRATKELFRILDLTPFEVEKGIILPISFQQKLLSLAKNKNVLTLLDHFNKHVTKDRIQFLKQNVNQFLSRDTNFDEFIAVLFQDTTPSHLLFLKSKIDSRSFSIIEKSNELFFSSLADANERKNLFGFSESISNPYHFYVIRYLSQSLAKKFPYEISALVAFLFNYTYEIFESESNTAYFFNDPERLKDPQENKDILVGLKGAYYQDYNLNLELANQALSTSVKDFIGTLGHRVITPKQKLTVTFK